MRGFAHESSHNETVEWYTPKWVFDALNITFDLDPCSPQTGGFVPARRKLWKPDFDGLAEPWEGNVWLNPPYGAETKLWVNRLAEHGEGIALVFSRTGTKWFQNVAPRTSAVCFVSKRIRFINGLTGDAGGTPGADSMLIAFGSANANVLRFSNLGSVFAYDCFR
jgi:hypothetical protein